MKATGSSSQHKKSLSPTSGGRKDGDQAEDSIMSKEASQKGEP